MTDRTSHRNVDEALADAARAARGARLSPRLRSRILAASRPAGAAPSRGRVIDLVLRAAAVAAAFAAVLFVMPDSIEAADFDTGSLASLDERITTSIAAHLPTLGGVTTAVGEAVDGLSADPGSPLPTDHAALLAAAAALLVGVGLWFVRRERSR